MDHKIYLVNRDLMAFNLDSRESPIRPDGFGKNFGPQQIVDVVFNSDRSGPAWAKASPNSGGFMERYSFQGGVRAYGLVYVLASLDAAEKPLIGPHRKKGEGMLSMSLGDPREETIRNLVHELAHVRQAWMLPQDYATQYQRSGPYNGNLFETAAFSLADRFVTQNRVRIKEGGFDRYLPAWIIPKLPHQRRF